MLNILIVDDSIMLRKKLTTILTNLGHNVIGTAKNGIEAIDLTKKLKPDLITMDILMPNMNGIEAIKKIKEYDEKVVIIVVSADDKEEDILMSFKEGAIGYLIKPFTIEQVKKEISNTFSEKCVKQNDDNLNGNLMVAIDKTILDTITVETKRFLTKHIDTDYKSIKTMQSNSNKLILNDYTVVIYVHGKLNFTIMMSLEENLVKNITNTFLSGEKIEENEKMIIYKSAAKETLNTVTGLSLASFTNEGNGLTMSPPFSVNYAKIREYENMLTFSEDLLTNYGKLSISVINYNMKDI